MKSILLAITLLFSLSLASQDTEKQPKLRYTTGFFNTKWELGDKDMSEKQVQLHLEKHDSDAYFNFRRAKSLETQTAWYLILGGAGTLGGAFKKDEAALVE